MKKIKISLLAVLALLTIGLTSATKAGLFKETTKDLYECRKDIDYIKVNLQGLGNYYNDDFPLGPGNINCPGVLDEKCAILVTPTPITFQCDAENEEFCCAEVLETTGCDPEFPARVKIHCKDDE